MLLGDAVEKALSMVGVTKERVEQVLGRPCNCVMRKARLNALHRWAAKLIAGDWSMAEEGSLPSVVHEARKEEGRG